MYDHPNENHQNINSLKRTLSELKCNLHESQKYEHELRLALAAQVQKSTELQEELNKEKMLNNRLLEVENEFLSSSDESSSVNKKGPPATQFESSGRSNDPKHTFGTVSTVLMQYKYDELSLSYKRCIKSLSKKDKQIKIFMSEAEELQDQINKYKVINRRLEERIESLCCKYLSLKARKGREIVRLQTSLDCANQMVNYLKKMKQEELGKIIDGADEKDAFFINQINLCDKLVLKNIELERQIECLKAGIVLK